MDANSLSETALLENEQEILAWIQRNAIPLQHLEAGNDFVDLQPLKALLKGVRVVGLGETTHGTRQFFQMKHRLLEFLVLEMGFTAFAMEASFAACQPINEYVLHGTGDRAAVLTGQGYIPWDAEEVAQLVDWMRAYNEAVPDEKKVRFYGLDVWRNDIGRKAVLDYFAKVAPGRLAAAQNLFQGIAREEAKWPMRIDDDARKTIGQLIPQVQELIETLASHRDELVRLSSAAEFTRCLQYMRVMQQWLQENGGDLAAKAEGNNRSAFMAENLIYLMDQAGPEAKFVVWAHNGHIVSGAYIQAIKPNLGSRLREKFGNQYFACGFEFGGGSFLARTALPENLLGDLQEITVPGAPAGSYPWYFARAGMGNFILNVNAPAGSAAVEEWRCAPRKMQQGNWVCDEIYFYELGLAGKYDGMIFIDRTTPIHPTANAYQTAAERKWL